MIESLTSLEERLYSDFYDKLERDKERNGEFSRSMSGLGKNARYVMGAIALFLGGNLIRKAKSKQKITKRRFIQEASLTVAATGLAIHFQKVKDIFEQVYRKNTGEELTPEEIDEVKTDGLVGRVSHYVGAVGVGVGITTIATASRREFLISIPFFAIAPLWYKYTIHEGYDALYNSATDYAAGERRFKKPTTSQK